MRRCAGLAAVCALALGGCVVPSPAVTGGSDLSVEAAKRAAAGARTSRELLRELGPPVAIFSRGGREPVMRAPTWATKIPAAHVAAKADAAPAFELFADVRPPGADDVVYFWFHSRSTKTGVVAPLAVGEWSSLSLVRLWALVDPRTGAVRRVAFRSDD